jgi:hypothetical protein
MFHKLLFTVFSLVWMSSAAFAGEENQPVLIPGATAPVVAYGSHQAVERNKPLRFLLGLGVTFGGDTLATASYTNGSSQNITAGGGMMLYGGMDYRLNDAISLQGTLGYHFDDTKAATNGSLKFTRIPLDLLAYYHVNDNIRIGGGVRYVNSPELKGSGVASGINGSFDNTVGLVIEGEYLFKQRFGIKLRHVSENYRSSGSSVSINGSHFGVLASFYF